MFRFFRRATSPYQTSLAMIGAKSGDRVLFVGSEDAGLPAHLAAITGLNGQTVVVADPDGKHRIEAAAAKVGSLVEVVSSPGEQPYRDFDVAVWETSLGAVAENERGPQMVEMLIALRPGGRAMVLDRVALKRWAGAVPTVRPETVITLLMGAGARAARTLGSADGMTYYEARRPA